MMGAVLWSGMAAGDSHVHKVAVIVYADIACPEQSIPLISTQASKAKYVMNEIQFLPHLSSLAAGLRKRAWQI